MRFKYIPFIGLFEAIHLRSSTSNMFDWFEASVEVDREIVITIITTIVLFVFVVLVIRIGGLA